MTHVLLCVLAAAVPAEKADVYRPEVGQPHPAFVLPEIRSGESVSLDKYRGRKVLLFHFASW